MNRKVFFIIPFLLSFSLSSQAQEKKLKDPERTERTIKIVNGKGTSNYLRVVEIRYADSQVPVKYRFEHCVPQAEYSAECKSIFIRLNGEDAIFTQGEITALEREWLDQ